MRKLVMATTMIAGLAALPASAIEPSIAPGETIEVRVDGDLDGDGAADLAYVVGTAHWRELRVALSGRGEIEALDLRLGALSPGSLAIEGNVLMFGDVTGDPTAYAAMRRYRYDSLRKRMRLIGMDATVYSLIPAHDGFEATWNLVNGDVVTHELRLVEGAGEDPYEPVRERRFKQRIRPQWLADTPDPETMLDEMRQG